MHTGPEDDREREWPPLLAILAVFAAGWLLVGPRANVPVIDDWVYAWSVEHFLKTGRLEVLDISAFYPIAQILWGALFALVAGFSFTTLRASTVIVAVVGCCAVYLTLRELGCRRSTSLLGALALAVDPAYFALSFSFMTDVPFTSISTVTLYWYVRAVRRGEANAVWIGSLFAILAFLIRPIGIVLPLAMVPALIWNRKSRLTVPHSPAPLVATLLIMGALQVAMPRLFGPLDWAAIRQDYLRWWFTVPIASYLRWNVEVLFVAVFPLAPLLLASVARARRAIAVCAAALVLAIACRVAVGGLVMPLPRGQTWSLQDIAARSMFDGEVTAPAWSLRAVPLVKVLGLLTVGALLVGARGWRQRLASCLASPRGEPVIIALMVLQAAAINRTMSAHRRITRRPATPTPRTRGRGR